MVFGHCGIVQALGTSFSGRGIVNGSWGLFAIHRPTCRAGYSLGMLTGWPQ